VTPLATAIVLNHNGRGYVEAAVESLLRQDLEPLEVLVVDNGSTDGSDAALEERFGARIRLLRAGRNLGFGAGNNLGIRDSGAPHVVLLNNDAVAAPGFVRELVSAAEADPRIGMVAAKVLDAEGQRIDTVGHLLYPDGLNRGRGRLEPDRGQYDGCREALFPSGAAALYRRAMLDEVGLFDEAFFLYGDDAELGLRGRLAGWGCALAPRAVAYHHYSRSAGAYSSLKAFHVERNRVLVLLELFPLVLILLSPFFTLARLSLHAWGALSGRGAAARLAHDTSPVHLVGVTLRAYWSALGLAPHALAARARFRPLRRLNTAAFLRLLAQYRLRAAEAALKD
jgi:GT2 family glycosyltransferase